MSAPVAFRGRPALHWAWTAAPAPSPPTLLPRSLDGATRLERRDGADAAAMLGHGIEQAGQAATGLPPAPSHSAALWAAGLGTLSPPPLLAPAGAA